MSDLYKDEATNEFLNRVIETDFEDGDYGTFRITHLVGDERAFSLVCSVTIDDEPDFHQRWRLEFEGVRRSTIALGYVDSIGVSDDHVLLNEYSESELRLGFRGKIDRPALLVGELYRAHFAITYDWIPFSSYLNQEVEIAQLIEEGFGTLAVGPKTFIDLYNTILKANGISTSVTDESTPKEWDGSVFSDFPRLTAFIFDDRYVIAETATAKKSG